MESSSICAIRRVDPAHDYVNNGVNEDEDNDNDSQKYENLSISSQPNEDIQGEDRIYEELPSSDSELHVEENTQKKQEDGEHLSSSDEEPNCDEDKTKRFQFKQKSQSIRGYCVPPEQDCNVYIENTEEDFECKGNTHFGKSKQNVCCWTIKRNCITSRSIIIILIFLLTVAVGSIIALYFLYPMMLLMKR